jgi:4-carboxymuconolactone decarboxylase
VPSEEAMAKLPRAFVGFNGEFPSVGRAWEALGAACAQAGPLDPRTRELVKLALAVGARLEGGVHAHARRALEAGATREQVRHVVALAPSTVGFPTAVAAFTWVADVIGPRKKRGRR